MKKNLFTLAILLLILSRFPGKTFAQCPAGFSSVSVIVETHINGYEVYWQLVNDSSACDSNVVFSGGNTQQIDCNGANANVATPGHGYDNYDTIVEGPWCLNIDSMYSIQYIDDSGASDNFFTVLINGFPIYHFHTLSNQHTFTFTITPPFQFNFGLEAIHTLNYVNPGNVEIEGMLFSYSTDTIDSLDLNYTINNGPVVSQNITGLNIIPFTEYHFMHPIPWGATDGDYSLKVWASNLNGNADMDHANDTMIKPIVVGPPIPDYIDQYLTVTPVFTLIADSSDLIYNPSDLDFQTILSRYELWVLNMADTNVNGSTVTIYHAGQPNQYSLLKQDPNAGHFMFRPSGIAFSDNTNFATSAAVLDAHHLFGHFAGPTLWTSDTSIYAHYFPGVLGSHIDMLHQSPWGMGITEEHENAFWVFDGYNQRITRYDYVNDHGPGHDNHEDGIVRRYNDIVINRINDTIPSHMVLDHSTGWLYVVDNGNARVVRMDINTGSVTGVFPVYAEPLAEHSIVTGTTWGTFISSGIMQPCGIDLINDRLIVSDYSNGDIIIYDNSGATGVELGRIHTGTPGIAGVKIGPDGKIWYVNMSQHKVFRIDGVTSVQDQTISNNIYVYPNPANDHLFVMLENKVNARPVNLKLFNAVGQLVFAETNYESGKFKIDTHSLQSGIYILAVADVDEIVTKKIVVQH